MFPVSADDWQKVMFAELLKEGKLIQSHLRSFFGKHHNESNKLARTFSRLMMEGMQD